MEPSKQETLEAGDAYNDDVSEYTFQTASTGPYTPRNPPDDVEVSEQMAELSIDRDQLLKWAAEKLPVSMETATSGASSNQTAADVVEVYEKDGGVTNVSLPQCKMFGDAAVGIVFDSKMQLHELQSGHVECPARVLVPMERLAEEGILGRCYRIKSREAERDELLAGHTESHLNFVEKGYKPGEEELSGDVYFSADTAACARLSAGCCIQAAECVASSEVDRSFAMIRPPGHHAESCEAMGFCFYNNVALAALKLLRSGEAARIVVVDWDVHHGNGIQNMLYEDPRVLYISIHRGGNFYPNTGKVTETGTGPGLGYNVNIPFPKRGFGDLDYLAVFSVLVEPLIRDFDPDVVLVSAGFDAAEFDPLGGMKVSPECYGHMTRKLLQFAQGKLVMALEGGYNLNSVAESITSCMKVLLGEEPEGIDPGKLLCPETEKVVLSVGRQLATLWPCMMPDPVQERWDRFLDEIDSEQEDSKEDNDSSFLFK